MFPWYNLIRILPMRSTQVEDEIIQIKIRETSTLNVLNRKIYRLQYVRCRSGMGSCQEVRSETIFVV